jgi:hypothetical protein
MLCWRKMMKILKKIQQRKQLSKVAFVYFSINKEIKNKGYEKFPSCISIIENAIYSTVKLMVQIIHQIGIEYILALKLNAQHTRR